MRMSRLITWRCGNRTALACLQLAGLALAGCAAPPKTTLHTEDTLLGRRLYDTEPAFIYASSQAAADEAGADLAVAIRDYRKATGRTPAGKALLVVSDKSDAPYGDRDTVLRMGQRVADMQKFDAQASQPANLEEKLRKAEQDLGPEVLDTLFLSRPGTADCAEAVKLWGLADRPAAGASWVLAVPTGELARHAMRLAIDKAMEKKDVSAAARVFMAPFLLLIDGKAREAARADRQVAAFLMLASHDRSLDAAARKAAVQKYLQAKEQDVMQGMPSPARKEASRQPAGAVAPARQSTGATPSTRSSE